MTVVKYTISKLGALYVIMYRTAHPSTGLGSTARLYRVSTLGFRISAGLLLPNSLSKRAPVTSDK